MIIANVISHRLAISIQMYLSVLRFIMAYVNLNTIAKI
jgi:hypothetical protein